MTALTPVAASLALCLSGGAAAALSCMPADVTRSYAEAAAAEEGYMILHGTLAFDAGQLPGAYASDLDTAVQPAPVAARFTGSYLGATGRFTGAMESLPVVLEPRCAGPYCGDVAPGEDLLAFARMEGDVPHFELSPCPGKLFRHPRDEDLAQVTACFTGAATCGG
ncbi:hypothetical protein [Pseudoroseicyclus sp. CXY001]|uniref:hypothetical protein n=1 Tax=Pseudoroseicyclus sp. CXY001 TaxID=3242492 RepID=UPI0035712EC6